MSHSADGIVGTLTLSLCQNKGYQGLAKQVSGNFSQTNQSQGGVNPMNKELTLCGWEECQAIHGI